MINWTWFTEDHFPWSGVTSPIMAYLSLVSPGRTVCRSVQLVPYLERSLEVIWSCLPSCRDRCYTAATSRCHVLATSVAGRRGEIEWLEARELTLGCGSGGNVHAGATAMQRTPPVPS